MEKDTVKLSKNSEEITVYHGTALPLGEKIKTHGIRPRPDNKYAYFTTDEKVAKQYALAWTAFYMKEAAAQLKIKNPKPVGAILTFAFPKEWLQNDPYNPEGEPNQYRIKGSTLYRGMHKYPLKLEKIDFPQLNDSTELLKAYCYWIGIGQASDGDGDGEENDNYDLGGPNKFIKENKVLRFSEFSK